MTSRHLKNKLHLLSIYPAFFLLQRTFGAVALLSFELVHVCYMLLRKSFETSDDTHLVYLNEMYIV